jgi:hypothetical protein
MSTRFEAEPWFPKWRAALDCVIAAQMARDGAKRGTAEREVAVREYEEALALFRSIAVQIRA